MNYAKYQVIELVDDAGLPRYIAIQRAGESFLQLVWAHRFAVNNALSRWLRGLDSPPECRAILGTAVPLTWATARSLMRFRREEVARMAGTDGPPDFALWPAMNLGGRDHRRPVCRVSRDGRVETFASVEAAAIAAETSRDDIAERLEAGHRDQQGWAWFDA